MLKNAKEKYIDILTVDDYVELFGKPNNTFGEADQELLYKLIKQATTQFDSLVSGSGNVGFLFRWWESLKDNDIDNSRGYRLQKAIGSWVETMVQTGKFWVDGLPQMSSNIDYNISSSSSNSNIEEKRKDIIQDLTAIGLTITSNVGSVVNEAEIAQETDDLLVYSKNYLNNNYVSLNSLGENQALKSGINFAENPIVNGGDISNTNPNKKKIINYRLQGCEIDGLDGNNIIGVQNAQTANKILDPNDNTYKLINQFPISYWDGLTREQIYSAITAGGILWNPDTIYREGFVVVYQIAQIGKKQAKDGNLYGYAKSLQNDNVGNDPNTSPEYWEILPFQPTNLEAIIEYVNNWLTQLENHLAQETIPNEIQNQLNNLPTVEYVSEGNSEIIEFESEADFEAYKQAMEVDDSYFQDLESDGVYNVPVLRTNGFTPIIIDNLLDDIPYHSSFKTINIRFDLFLLDMNAPTQPLTSYVSINMSSILPNWQSRQVIAIPRKDDSGTPMFVLFKWTAVVTSNYKYNMMFEWEPINLTLEEQAGVILSLENMRVWTK